MLTDLRVKLRNRRSRISSCGFQDFLPLTKQFFAFLDSNPVLKAVIAELLARNQESVSEVAASDLLIKQGGRLFGDNAEQAATISYLVWRKFASQNSEHGFYSHGLGSGNFDTASGVYKDWYVEPLFDYLDETLDDANVVLAMLIRYKEKVEWYRRSEVMAKYSNDTQRGEEHVKKHMFEFLFEQGLSFHAEPVAASGKPDVVSLDNSQFPFVGDAKIFDAESRGASYIKKGFYQVFHYCCDYNSPVGYLIVFNVSKKQLRVELASAPDGIPRFEYNHKTIFLIVIDLYEHEGTASTRGVADTVTITASELIREVEESTQASQK
jgi:hypothetical protein